MLLDSSWCAQIAMSFFSSTRVVRTFRLNPKATEFTPKAMDSLTPGRVDSAVDRHLPMLHPHTPFHNSFLFIFPSLSLLEPRGGSKPSCCVGVGFPNKSHPCKHQPCGQHATPTSQESPTCPSHWTHVSFVRSGCNLQSNLGSSCCCCDKTIANKRRRTRYKHLVRLLLILCHCSDVD